MVINYSSELTFKPKETWEEIGAQAVMQGKVDMNKDQPQSFTAPTKGDPHQLCR